MTQEDTAHAPVFSEVWKQVAPKIEGFPLVAHNKAFDERCLKAVFRTYCMDYPDYDFYCTYQASRKLKGLRNHQLHTVAGFLVLNWRITIMRWLMLRRVHGLPDRFCEL